VSEPGKAGRMTGWILVVVGGVYSLTVGGCSSLFLVSALERPSEVSLVLAIAGIFLAPGLLALAGGVYLVKKNRPRATGISQQEEP
jgi:hypothetical protein